jgi:RHS repeat-associated protein
LVSSSGGSSPGFSFGTVVRFTAASGALAGSLELVLEEGAVVDEWSLASAAETLPFTFVPVPGTVLATTGAATAPVASARSRVGLSILFHGQVFDADAGLYYLRARFYDPASGLFLERDPEEYVDGPNHYAAFAHDPVSLRDPTGRSVLKKAMSWVKRKLKRGGGPPAGTDGLGVKRWREGGSPEWARTRARPAADGTTRWSVGQGAKMPAEVGGVTRWSVPPTRATGGGRAQEALDALRRRDFLGYFKKEAELLDVSTRRDGAVFWSGRKSDVSNQVPARAFAETNGRQILEMTPGGKRLDDLRLFEPGSPLSGHDALDVFKILSGRFAGKASGTAVGFVHGMRPQSVFNTIELDALLRNPRVTNLITELLE